MIAFKSTVVTSGNPESTSRKAPLNLRTIMFAFSDGFSVQGGIVRTTIGAPKSSARTVSRIAQIATLYVSGVDDPCANIFLSMSGLLVLCIAVNKGGPYHHAGICFSNNHLIFITHVAETIIGTS